MNARNLTRVICAVLAFSLAGCLGGAKVTATPTPDLSYTQAAETIVAELTRNAPPPTIPPPPTDTLAVAMELPSETPVEEMVLPTETPTLEELPPTSTPLPTDTPLPTEAPTVALPPTEVIVPTQTATVEPLFKLVYRDTFNPTSFWWVEKEDEYDLRFGLGGYVVVNKVKDDAVYSIREKMQMSNVRIEIEAHKLEGPTDGYYGVVCRFIDGSNYYLLVAGSDGRYGIGKQKQGELRWLKEGQDTSGAVYTGTAVNQIRGDCIGNTLTLYVNGQKLLEVQDTEWSSGAIGIAVGTRKQPGYAVVFTSFMVFVPEKP